MEVEKEDSVFVGIPKRTVSEAQKAHLAKAREMKKQKREHLEAIAYDEERRKKKKKKEAMITTLLRGEIDKTRAETNAKIDAINNELSQYRAITQERGDPSRKRKRVTRGSEDEDDEGWINPAMKPAVAALGTAILGSTLFLYQKTSSQKGGSFNGNSFI